MNMLDRIRLQNTLDVDRSVRNLQSLDRNMRNTNPSQILDILLVQIVREAHPPPFILHASMV